MHVCLHTIREISPGFVGGTERLLIELAKELNTLGHQTTLVTSGGRGDIEVEGVRVSQRLPGSLRDIYQRHGFANSAFIRDCIASAPTHKDGLRLVGEYADQQLHDAHADIIHLNSFAAALFSERAVGAVVTSHENDLEQERTWGAELATWMAACVRDGETRLNEAAALSTPSAYYAQYFSSLFGLPVTHMKGGVSLSSFERSRRRRAYRPQPDEVRVLLPARFDPYQKGHDIALEACAVLKAQGVKARFVFSGVRDDYKDRLVSFYAMAQHYGVEDCVEAARFWDIREGYDDCDVAVSPERYCSYGLSISETLALGVPTVLSDIPTYREIANGFAHAFFVPVADATALAQAIVQAADTPEVTRDREAIRFRMIHDLRSSAGALSNLYQVIQNNSAA